MQEQFLPISSLSNWGEKIKMKDPISAFSNKDVDVEFKFIHWRRNSWLERIWRMRWEDISQFSEGPQFHRLYGKNMEWDNVFFNRPGGRSVIYAHIYNHFFVLWLWDIIPVHVLALSVPTVDKASLLWENILWDFRIVQELYRDHLY